MNRRVLLKNLSLATAGATLSGLLYADQRHVEISYAVVTDDAAWAVAQLRKWGFDHSDAMAITKTSIAASGQDLAVIRSGRLVRPEDLVGWEADFAADLRNRRTPGDHLVTVARHTDQPPRTVEFRVDGRLVERVSLDQRYRHIEILGQEGLTVFSVEEGNLSVESSSCRRKLCRKCGSVHTGQIVCAPNRLVATIAGATRRYDAITG